MPNRTELPMIAHLVFKLDYGGLENGLVNIINNLPDGEFQHSIICLTNYSEFSERIRKPGVKIFSINKREGKDIRAYLRLYSLLKEIKPTIFHTRNLATIEGQLWAFLARVPKRLHGEHGRDIDDPYGDNRKNIIIRKIFGLFVHHFIAVSNDLYDYLINIVQLDKRNVSQIYNGVDTGKFRPQVSKKNNYLSKILMGHEFIVIGTVGRLEKIKDQLTLVKSFAVLIKNNPDLAKNVRLVLVGDGSMRASILQEVEKHALSDLVYLLGSKDQVSSILNDFDIFVLPSLAEGISNTILEAMSTGLPVVATRVGGNAELVSEEKTGILVPPDDAKSMADALLRYIEDRSLRDAHGSAGRELIEKKFSLTVMVEHYRSLYSSMITNTVLS